MVQQLQDLAGDDLDTPLPGLTNDLYSHLHRTGERLPFERVWQERRRRLARAAVRLLLDPAAGARPGGVWWAQLLAAIQELMAEPSWAWPAHVRDPSGIDAGVIDLFAAETANLCGELVSLFGPWLPPAWLDAIRQRVIERMVLPFLTTPANYSWSSKPSNWNAVCHQGLIGAALALDPEAPWLAEFVETSRERLGLFLDGFSAYGSCLEGITYWEYGFGWFALLNEQLERWSSGAQSLIAGQEGRITAIAHFGPAMLLSNRQLVNFADSRLDMPPRASLLMLLGRRLVLPECIQAGVQLYCHALDGGLDLHGQRCDLFYLTRMLLEAPTAEALAAKQESVCSDWIDHDAGLVVVRRSDQRGRCWELAVKGGHNAEPHNHNDCGSFLLNLDGERLAIELGAPEYTSDTFGPKRYSLLATRSSGHSVPIVNGLEQAAGLKFDAKLLAVEAGSSEVRVQLDLTRAYPEEAGHERVLRTIELNIAAGVLRVKDELWGPPGLVLQSVLMSPTEQMESLGLQPLEDTELNSVEALFYRDNRGEDKLVYRWLFRLNEQSSLSHGGRNYSVGYQISQ